ncbi:MAG: hypothetical protein HY652_10985 [Acidobacteria bacterium]|nr:hypothetical protein [Acidobacteriota bacterium]
MILSHAGPRRQSLAGALCIILSPASFGSPGSTGSGVVPGSFQRLWSELEQRYGEVSATSGSVRVDAGPGSPLLLRFRVREDAEAGSYPLSAEIDQG